MPQTPREGRPIGSGYTLTSLIGGGAMGQVWRGTTRSGEPVAIKILRPELTGDPEFISRFLSEAQILTRLNHPNLVRVSDLVAEGSSLSIVMELLSGPDLRTELRRLGTFTPGEALNITDQLLAGLGAIHAAGIVHRDLKPENVLVNVTPNGTGLTITDFGISRLIEQGPGARSTSVIGTPEYMAPELADGEIPTPQSDLYAMGIMLYEFVTGITPFTGGSPLAVLRRHVDQVPAQPAGVPDSLWALITTMIAKRPADRPRSTDEVRARIAQIAPLLGEAPRLQPLGAPPAPAASISSTQMVNARPDADPGRSTDVNKKRKRWVLPVAAVAAFVLILGAAGGIWALTRPGSATETVANPAGTPVATTAAPTSTRTSDRTPTPTGTPSPGSNRGAVPAVTGLTLASATTTLRGEGFRVEIKEVLDDTKPDATVVEQSPVEGEPAPDGVVTLTVSRKAVGVWLADQPILEGYAQSGSVNINGEAFPHGIYASVGPSGSSWQYDLGRQYRTLNTRVGLTDDSDSGALIRYEILLDGRPVFTKDMRLGESEDLELDVTGALRLKISGTIIERSRGWQRVNLGMGDPQLLGLPAEIQTTPTATPSR